MNKFPFSEKVKIVLPSNFTDLSKVEVEQVRSWRKLFEEHRNSFSRELGAEFEFSSVDSGEGERWLVGPRQTNPSISSYLTEPAKGPLLFLDRKSKVLITDGPSPQEVIETFSYIRSLWKFEGGKMPISDCTNNREVANRVAREVKYSLSSLEMKEINWDSLCNKYVPLVEVAKKPIPVLQEWLAQLGDGHTWVRPVPPLGELPHKVWCDGKQAIFQEVKFNSTAWDIGVRPGYKLLTNDMEDWWRRTASTPHCKPLLVGRRLLSGKVDSIMDLKAESPNGEITRWKERLVGSPWEPFVEHRILKSGFGYIKIRAWILGKGFNEKIDTALDEFKNLKMLIVDLRGNPGGNLLLAHSFRDRFLDKKRQVGWIQQTLPNGKLSKLEPITGEPNQMHSCWSGKVCFLTDPLTYSASEDALLGLQGMRNVTVIGEASGGGSGRLRLIRLLPGWMLTITTALTYDMYGNCIEGSGIPVDKKVPVNRLNPIGDVVLKTAEDMIQL